jgi:hypothetical protein
MLTNIIKATRTHYAALQHRSSPDRLPLHYTVEGQAETCISVITRGTIQVKADTNAKRSRELTKLTNRLQTMYPEASHIEASFK